MDVCIKHFRFFSRLVVEGLVDFKRKVPKIMEPIGLAFDDFNFVIDAFKFASVDSILAMIKNAIMIPIQHLGKRI